MSSNCPVLPHEWFNFNPTDEQLISFLKLKILGMDSRVDSYIALVDFCKWEPWELPSQSKMESNNGVWWFLCRPDYKYLNSNRSNRTTKTGYWKKTGPERKTKGCIGRKRILVFHEGPSPGKKTNWVLHEYYYPQPSVPSRLQKPTFVICRVKYDPYKKGGKADTPEPSDENTSSLESSEASDVIPEVNCQEEEVNCQSFPQPLNLPGFLSIEQIQSSLFDDEMQVPCGADESNKYFAEFAKLIKVGPQENNYEETTDIVGVNEWVNQYRSLAIGD